MSSPLGEAAVLSRHRLAYGLEVADVLLDAPADVVVAVEDVPVPFRPPPSTTAAADVRDPGLGLPRLHRGRFPGRFGQPFTPGLTPPATLRVIDPRRRFVARRLILPFAALSAILAEETAGVRPVPRGRRIAVFPGSAYGPHGSATGLRGRVVDGSGAPVPWVRVAARHASEDQVVGRAHGDDRGEFLLLPSPAPTPTAVPAALEFTVRLAVAVPPPPPGTGPVGAADDPLIRLPAEQLPAPGVPDDDVCAGTALPAGYTVALETTAALRLGRILSPQAPLIVP